MKRAVSIFQEKCYGKLEQYASSEDYSRQYSVRVIRRFIGNLKSGKKILDVGCADGEMLGCFVGRHKIWGVDIAANLVKFAEKRGIRAVVADVEKELPYKDEFFDVIVVHHVIEHVLNTDGFLMECNRVLKKNGIFLLTFPNVSSPLSLVLFLVDLPSYQSARYRSVHVRDFTLRTIRVALINHGFAIGKIFGGSFLILKNNYLSLLTRVSHRFAAEITLIAYKRKRSSFGQRGIFSFSQMDLG